MTREPLLLLSCLLAMVAIFVLSLGSIGLAGRVTSDPTSSSLRNLALHYDPTGKMTLSDQFRADFYPTRPHMALGYRSGTVWLRFDLQAEPKGKPLLLRIGVPNLDWVVLHYLDKAGKWRQVVTGDRLSLSDRPWASPRLGFVIDPSDLGGEQVYLSIRSAGTLGINLNIGAFAAMNRLDRAEDIGNLTYFFMLVASIILATQFYLRDKNGLFLLFAVAQISHMFGFFSYTGYLSVLLPELVTDHVTSFWVPISTFTIAVFNVFFFRVLGAGQRVNVTGLALIVVSGLSMVVLLFIDHGLVLKVSAGMGALVTLWMAVSAWTLPGLVYLSRSSLRMIYTVFALSIAVWILPMVGLLPVTRLSFASPILQGLLNIVLVFSLLYRASKREAELRALAEQALAEQRIETELRQRQSRLYRDLLLTVSHEVGTHLSVLRLGIERTRVGAALRARMDRAIASLGDIVAKFQQSERLEFAERLLRLRRLNLMPLVREEIALLPRDQGSHHVALSGPDFVTVRGDEIYIRIALANLLNNAQKYASPGSVVEVVVKSDGDRVCISVTNRCSVGLQPDEKRVFDPFYRGDKALSQPGTGLGLYIVRQTMRMMNGECSFEKLSDEMVRARLCLQKED